MESRTRFVKLLSEASVVTYLKALMPLAYPRRPIDEVFDASAMKKIVDTFGLDQGPAEVSHSTLVWVFLENIY